MSKALADKAIAAYNEAKKAKKLIIANGAENETEDLNLNQSNESDLLKKAAEAAQKQYEADLKAAQEAKTKALEAKAEYEKTQNQLTSKVSSAKTVESQLRDTQKRIESQQTLLAKTVAEKERLNKLISKAQVELNTKKVALIKAKSAQITYENQAKKASQILSSNIDWQRSNQKLIDATNNAIEQVKVAQLKVDQAKQALKEFSAPKTDNLISRNLPIIIGSTFTIAVAIFTSFAINRRRRRGATQTVLDTPHSPDDYDKELKLRRTKIDTDKSDLEFEEFLENIRSKNAKLLKTIESEFSIKPINTDSPKIVAKSPAKKIKAESKKPSKSKASKAKPAAKSAASSKKTKGTKPKKKK